MPSGGGSLQHLTARNFPSATLGLQVRIHASMHDFLHHAVSVTHFVRNITEAAPQTWLRAISSKAHAPSDDGHELAAQRGCSHCRVSTYLTSVMLQTQSIDFLWQKRTPLYNERQKQMQCSTSCCKSKCSAALSCQKHIFIPFSLLQHVLTAPTAVFIGCMYWCA
jgi:hypothetical protein